MARSNSSNVGSTLVQIVGVLVVLIVGWVIAEKLMTAGGSGSSGLTGGGADSLGSGLSQLLNALGLGNGSAKPGGGLGFSGNASNSGNGSFGSTGLTQASFTQQFINMWNNDSNALWSDLNQNDSLNGIGTDNAFIQPQSTDNIYFNQDPVYSSGDAGISDLSGDTGDSGNYDYGTNSGSDGGSNYDGSGDDGSGD